MYVASCKPFDFGAYPDDEPDSGILNGIITRRDRVNSMNFCGSAGSAAVRSLRLILICYSTHLCEMRGRKDSTSPKSLKKLSFFVLRKSLSLIPSSVATRFFISDILIAHFTLSLTYLLTTTTTTTTTTTNTNTTQARSYVQARGGSCLVVPRRLNFFETQIIRKIIKIVATRCQILTLKCTQIDFDFGWGSAPDSAGAGGAYSAPPDHLAGFKGPTSKERGV